MGFKLYPKENKCCFDLSLNCSLLAIPYSNGCKGGEV